VKLARFPFSSTKNKKRVDRKVNPFALDITGIEQRTVLGEQYAKLIVRAQVQQCSGFYVDPDSHPERVPQRKGIEASVAHDHRADAERLDRSEGSEREKNGGLLAVSSGSVDGNGHKTGSCATPGTMDEELQAGGAFRKIPDFRNYAVDVPEPGRFCSSYLRLDSAAR